MKLNIRFIGIASFMFLVIPSLIAGCSKNSKKNLEDAEGDAAKATAQQMMDSKEAKDAVIAARNAAKPINIRKWGSGDSLKLQEAILEARTIALEYEKSGNPKLKEVFDTEFFNTIRTVHPEIADQLNPEVQPVEKDTLIPDSIYNS